VVADLGFPVNGKRIENEVKDHETAYIS
jgi:hypothetical protein